MSIIVQIALVWLCIAWFIPKLRHLNRATTYVWLFVILFSTSITLQAQSLYEVLSDLTGLNHIGWFISYVTGTTALFVCYKALTLGNEFGNKRVVKGLLYLTIFTNVASSFLYLAILKEPKGVNTLDPYSWPTLLFRLVTYIYTIIICTALTKIHYQYQRHEVVPYIRMRLMILFWSLLLGTSYFVLRTPYFVAVFLNPEITRTSFVQMLLQLLDVLALARLSWVFFFVPNSVYRKVYEIFVFLDKLLTLQRLEALQAQIFTLVPFATPKLNISYSWWQRLNNLDLLNYRALVGILDGKKSLQDYVSTTSTVSAQQRQLHLALATVVDDRQYHDLVQDYRKVSRKYRKWLK